MTGTRRERACSAREEREAARCEVSRVLNRVLVDCDTNVAALAAGLGVEEARIAEWRAPEKRPAVSVADAARMPPLVRMPLAEYVAGPGYMMAELPACESTPRAGIELHVCVVRETAEVVTKHAVAIADGRVDRREGAELESEINDAIRALLTLRECARQAQREGVVGVELQVHEGGRR